MLTLQLSNPYVSIKKLPAQDLPDLTILTGLNGAGKSHFLKAIETGSITVDGAVSGPFAAYYDWTTLRPASSRTDLRRFEIARDRAWTVFARAREGQMKELRTMIHGIPGVSELSLEDLHKEATVDEDARRFGAHRANILNHLTSPAPGPLEDGAVPRETLLAIAKAASKPIMLLTLDEFYEHFPLEPLQQDPFTAQIGALFAGYAHLRQMNLLDKLHAEEYPQEGSRFLTRHEFETRHGTPPWETLNRLFAVAKLPYSVTAPSPSASFYEPSLRRDDGVEVKFEDLSSGEKILTSVLCYLYSLDEKAGVFASPPLLLLDEIDAPLHPSMCQALIELFMDVVARYKKRIILATHSPSTVALAPEEAIHVMDRATGLITKTSRDAALRALTAGVPILSINLGHRRQVFVESDNDVEYYTSLEALCRAHLQPEISITFMSTGRDAGCDRVRGLVKKLEAAGNTTSCGIVDWDLEKEAKGRLLVLGQGDRYAIDNYLLDPILIAGIVAYEDKNAREVVGFQTNEPYTALENFDSARLQKIADKVLTYLGYTAPAATLVRCEFADGRSIDLPPDFLRLQGHALESLVKSKFTCLKRHHQEKMLKCAIINTVLHDVPSLIPRKLVDVLKAVQAL